MAARRAANGPSEFQVFVAEEVARITAEDGGAVTPAQARKIAGERWKAKKEEEKAAAKPPAVPMGFIVGCIHQLYACNDEETPASVAEKLGVDAHKMLEMNRSVYAGMTATTKLMSGTLLKLPARAGSGSSAKVKLFAKVQSSKTYTLTLRESDPVRMIKRLVGEKESISVKEQTVVLSGQQLDDKLTVSDYNLSDDVLVNVHVYGADMFEGQATGEVEEVEYDSSWMESAAGQRFLATENGKLWLQTEAARVWQQEKKQLDKERGRGAGGERGERAVAEGGQRNFLIFVKGEVARVRAQHPWMSYKEAQASALQTWRVNHGKDAHEHRAAWARLPSVCTWLHGYAVPPPADGADGCGGGAAAGVARKRSGEDSERAAKETAAEDAASEALAAALASGYNQSYDWNYRNRCAPARLSFPVQRFEVSRVALASRVLFFCQTDHLSTLEISRSARGLRRLRALPPARGRPATPQRLRLLREGAVRYADAPGAARQHALAHRQEGRADLSHDRHARNDDLRAERAPQNPSPPFLTPTELVRAGGPPGPALTPRVRAAPE